MASISTEAQVIGQGANEIIYTQTVKLQHEESKDLAQGLL